MSFFKRGSHQQKPETLSGNPTRILYVQSHIGMSGKALSAFDISPHLSTEFGSDRFKDEAKNIAKRKGIEPSFVMYAPNWISTFTYPLKASRDIISQGGGRVGWRHRHGGLTEVCDCTMPLLSGGSTKYAFTPGTSRCSGKMKSKPSGSKENDEAFSFGGINYRWIVDHGVGSKDSSHKLVKELPDRYITVAQWWTTKDWKRNGVLVVDENAVDLVLVTATCFASIIKRSQCSGGVGSEVVGNAVESAVSSAIGSAAG